MGTYNMTSPLIPTAERQDISQTAVYMHTLNHFFSLDGLGSPGYFALRKLLVHYGLRSRTAGSAVPAQGILSWSPRRGFNPISLRSKGIWRSSETEADRVCSRQRLPATFQPCSAPVSPPCCCPAGTEVATKSMQNTLLGLARAQEQATPFPASSMEQKETH